MKPAPVVLTIAGTDPSGGAGIAADLRVFQSLGLAGASVITAVNAQNSLGVRAIHKVPPRVVAAQIDAVAADYTVAAVKVGMLAGATTVSAVARRVRRRGLRNLVVDPVLSAKDGTVLLAPRGVSRLLEELAPLTLVLTPNVPEASVLARREIRNLDDAREAARILHGHGAGYVLIKGGHWDAEQPATDLLFDGVGFQELKGTRQAGPGVRGTGCILSAALAGYLALGAGVPEAAERAKDFVSEAIARAVHAGKGAPLWLGLPPAGK